MLILYLNDKMRAEADAVRRDSRASQHIYGDGRHRHGYGFGPVVRAAGGHGCSAASCSLFRYGLAQGIRSPLGGHVLRMYPDGCSAYGRMGLRCGMRRDRAVRALTRNRRGLRGGSVRDGIGPLCSGGGGRRRCIRGVPSSPRGFLLDAVPCRRARRRSGCEVPHGRFTGPAGASGHRASAAPVFGASARAARGRDGLGVVSSRRSVGPSSQRLDLSEVVHQAYRHGGSGARGTSPDGRGRMCGQL